MSHRVIGTCSVCGRVAPLGPRTGVILPHIGLDGEECPGVGHAEVKRFEKPKLKEPDYARERKKSRDKQSELF